jgi:deoxyadenosine/deoxycytidine kinase
MTQARVKQFVVIEGVIGVGKTTLASYISDLWKAVLVQEEFEENPYLEEFYRDRRRYAFQTQVTFLLSRYQQQQRLLQRDIFSPRVVSDYLFQKDRIFANVNLTDKELFLYDKLFPILERDVPTPDLVVYLQASTPTLLERIHRRARPYEVEMDEAYITALNEAYNFFSSTTTRRRSSCGYEQCGLFRTSTSATPHQPGRKSTQNRYTLLGEEDAE